MSQISLDDVQKETPPIIIENFMSDFYCDTTRVSTHSTSAYGGLEWNHSKIVDDFNNNLKMNNVTVYIEDDNTIEGQSLTHNFGMEQKVSPLVPPVTLQLAEYYEGNLGAITGVLMYKFLHDKTFDGKTYHCPRVDSREQEMQTLTLFLNTTDSELLVFDKHFLGARPKEVNVVERIPCVKGTAVIIDSNRFYSTTPSTTEDTCMMKIHFADIRNIGRAI